MNNLTFAPAATSDINQIWDYTAEQWGVDQADYYTDGIRDVCYELAEGSKSGRPANILKIT